MKGDPEERAAAVGRYIAESGATPCGRRQPCSA